MPLKKITFIAIFIFISISSNAQSLVSDSTAKAWFPDAKFGVFVHWLIDYSLPENTADITLNHKKYWLEANKAAASFTAKDYHPELWAKEFKSWGAKYTSLLMGKPHYDVYNDDKSINSENYFKSDK